VAQITVEYLDHMGKDLTVSNAARVSFKKKREEFLFEGDPRIRPSGRSDEKLVHDLAKEGHIAPFGHCFASFHVKAPIFVARQLVKHKFLRWSEISRRYVDDEPEFYTPEVWRGRSNDKKQGSDGVVKPYQGSYIFNSGSDPFTRSAGWMASGKGTSAIALQTYKALLAEGVAPEQARMVLPQSTMTEFYWSGSLDAFASMCVLRLKDDTQYETRLVAQQIDKVMSDLFPVSWKALVHDEA
jgi:thymidylate synthase (FAD)